MTTFKKSDDELQTVWAEVYAPLILDSQGDFMTAPEIRIAAWQFMSAGLTRKIDVNHDGQDYDCAVVESFIAREDDPVFIAGSWVVGIHIADPSLWGMVKSGELNGFSMEALAKRRKTSLEVTIPETVSGLTDDTDGHTHRFTVHYDPDGTFKGGSTDEVNGHSHAIGRGTLTEPAMGHTHRFSFVEQLRA